MFQQCAGCMRCHYTSKNKGDMNNKTKKQLADAISNALFGTEYLTYDPESGDNTIDRLGYVTMSDENALSAPIVCSVPCKNCDNMRDSFAKTMRIFARNYAQVFAQKRDVENAIVLHKLCINLSPFTSRFLHGILHRF